MMLAQYAYHTRNHVMCAQNDNTADVEPCQFCGTLFDVEFVPDPYAADMYGDYERVFICDDCAHDRSQSI